LSNNIDVDAEELNVVLSSSGQANVDEEDDIHIEDCDEGDDNSILPMPLLTDRANSKRLCIKCISDRISSPTKLLTDHEKYGGSLKILVRNSKMYRRNKLK
jgi:hypothetical protein